MKAILIKQGEELRKIFNQLTEELHNIRPENIKQEKRTYVFEKSLFYDIKKSERHANHVDVTFDFNDKGYGAHNMVLTLPRDFFIEYEHLDRYNLTLLEKDDLLDIQKFSESIEDYEMCVEIREVLKKLN